MSGEETFKVTASLTEAEMKELTRLLNLSQPTHRNIWRKLIAPAEAKHKRDFDADPPAAPAEPVP